VNPFLLVDYVLVRCLTGVVTSLVVLLKGRKAPAGRPTGIVCVKYTPGEIFGRQPMPMPGGERDPLPPYRRSLFYFLLFPNIIRNEQAGRASIQEERRGHAAKASSFLYN